MRFDDGFLDRMAPAIGRAYEAMDALEKGAIANPDENRMVGHYWLRDPGPAPRPPSSPREIRDTLAAVKAFAAGVHSGAIKPASAPRFTRVLSIGIGGSALGPEFVADALGDPAADKMAVHFLDNTDPDGFAREFARLGGAARPRRSASSSARAAGRPRPATACSPPPTPTRPPGSTSPGTPSPSPAPARRWTRRPTSEGWLARFPMWDWVGGRTSELSAVGLLPAALQGIDIDAMLAGAAACDAATRVHDTAKNPAALLALMWYHATGGKGLKDMVVLPYKDRLLLFSRYLQQLVMESLGKRLDLDGKRVDQGISVYGNKGSTDQHAYVQQLRDGVNNFFLTFIRVLEDGGKAVEVEPGVTPGDYLHGFLLGTREALYDNDRESVTITVPPGRRPDRRRPDRPVRAGGRVLRDPGQHQRLPPARRRGRQEGRRRDPRPPAQGALGRSRRRPQTADQIAAAAGAAESAETSSRSSNTSPPTAGSGSPTSGGPGETTFAKA